MSDTPTPEDRERVEVHVRRAPRYGVFMAVGAALGAFIAWLIAFLVRPVAAAGGPADTSPVLGLAVVVGFALGVGAGGLIAVLLDRASQRGTSKAAAERIVVEIGETLQTSDGGGHGAEAASPEAAGGEVRTASASASASASDETSSASDASPPEAEATAPPTAPKQPDGS